MPAGLLKRVRRQIFFGDLFIPTHKLWYVFRSGTWGTHEPAACDFRSLMARPRFDAHWHRMPVRTALSGKDAGVHELRSARADARAISASELLQVWELTRTLRETACHSCAYAG